MAGAGDLARGLLTDCSRLLTMPVSGQQVGGMLDLLGSGLAQNVCVDLSVVMAVAWPRTI
jgi:hypothetical protein